VKEKKKKRRRRRRRRRRRSRVREVERRVGECELVSRESPLSVALGRPAVRHPVRPSVFRSARARARERLIANHRATSDLVALFGGVVKESRVRLA